MGGNRRDRGSGRSVRRRRAGPAALLCALLVPASGALSGEALRLPGIFGDNMVLQREAPVPVWGWTGPGEEVTVSIAGHRAAARADAAGRWEVKLPAMKAGGPHEMTVSGGGTLKLANVLIGEVWICSGQSNMDMAVHMSDDAGKAVPEDRPLEIRLFKVPRRNSTVPETDVEASWQLCERRAAMKFSAVGFWFGREIHEQVKVPVGLIHSAVGGTPIEAWTPRAGAAAVPGLEDFVAEIDAADAAARKPPDPGGKGRPPRHPTGLWNGMIRPLAPLAIRGAIWYQGEANVKRPAKYDLKMKALIGGWRGAWGQGEFPFCFVQLAPYSKNDGRLPLIWEAQLKSLSIPNTGMAVTTDLIAGDRLWDHHPKQKREVGRRLALWALAGPYGRKDLVRSGPLYKSLTVEGGRARVGFDHAGGGLAARDGAALTHFEVAGADRKFVKAEAKIEGREVVVWSAAVPAPVAVRFGWHQEAQPNLVNREGLPASPFRTDDW